MSGGYILHESGNAQTLTAAKAGGSQNRLQVQSVSASYDDAAQSGTFEITSGGSPVYRMDFVGSFQQDFRFPWGVKSDITATLTAGVGMGSLNVTYSVGAPFT